jgi:hypothetical protein
VFESPITSGRFWAAVAAFREVMTSGSASEPELGKNLVRLGESVSPAMTQDGIKLLLMCGLVQKQENELTAGKRAKNVWSQDRPNGREEIAQRLLFQLIRGPRRDLSVIAFLEPEGVREYHPEVFEIIRDTGLLDKSNSGHEEFWSRLRTLGTFSPLPIDSEERHRRGSEAEVLSLGFEFDRLKQNGYQQLAKQVSLVSSNTLLGFDILSYTGEATSPNDLLEIEVKNLSINAIGQKFFHVTRNEAIRAETGPNRYVFHLWYTLGEEPVCYVVESRRILEHLPKEQSLYARWESCQVIWSEIEDLNTI